MPTNTVGYNRLILILGSLSAIAPFSIDMYLPAFESIAASLNTDIASVTLSLTSYFLGMSFGQLAYGPLLDRYGRKKPLILGLFLYILAAVGCTLSTSIESLIFFRLLLALGACVGIVSSRAIIRDLFSGNDVVRALSTLTMVFGVAPIIAPTIGAFIVARFGWRYIFLALAFMVMLMLYAVTQFLPESKSRDSSISLFPTNVTIEYLKVLKNRDFLIYTITGAASSAGFFSYIAGSPFVYMHLLGFSTAGFGWVFALNACGLIGGSQINRLLLKQFTSSAVLFAVTITQLAIGLLLLFGTASGFLSKEGIVILIFCYLFCCGSINPNATGLALQPFLKNAGSASALNGSLGMIAGSLASVCLSYLHDGTILPMTSAMTFFTVVGVVCLTTHLLRTKYKPSSVIDT